MDVESTVDGLLQLPRALQQHSGGHFSDSQSKNSKIAENYLLTRSGGDSKGLLIDESDLQTGHESTGKLDREALKRSIMNQMDGESEDDSENLERKPLQAQEGPKPHQRISQKETDGPYLDSITARRPLEDDLFGFQKQGERLVPSGVARMPNFLHQPPKHGGQLQPQTSNFSQFPSKPGHESANLPGSSMGNNRRSIVNELDTMPHQPNMLFGQKVSLNKLITPRAQEEIDHMGAIFSKKVDQSMSLKEELEVKQRLQSKLDKLRSLVSRNNVDLILT